MNSRTRLLAAIKGDEPDHVPLYCWYFGFMPPKYLRWVTAGEEILYWYTMRLEHIHTLPQPWDLEQDFRRVDKLLSIGLDDILEISVPWSLHPDVVVRDAREADLLSREYDTPAGVLRHMVRKTSEEQAPGWVIQPNCVPLFEDFNIPRAVEHAVSSPDDIEKVRYLLCDLTKEQMNAFKERMAKTKEFAIDRGVLTQAWTAFGMDGVAWLCGAEGAIVMALDEPSRFRELVEIMYDFDKRRTEIALSTGGVDMIVQRGWYSSTDFWSPRLFREFVLPYLKRLVDIVHQAGKLFAYAMTTGLMPLLDELKEAEIDLLYFADPVQDDLDLGEFRKQVDGAFAVAGGINSGVTLGSGDPDEIREAVHSAVRTLGPGGGFILSPVDALFLDTPENSLEILIEAWRDVRDYPILGT